MKAEQEEATKEFVNKHGIDLDKIKDIIHKSAGVGGTNDSTSKPNDDQFSLTRFTESPVKTHGAGGGGPRTTFRPPLRRMVVVSDMEFAGL